MLYVPLFRVYAAFPWLMHELHSGRNVNTTSSFQGLYKSTLISIGRQAPEVSVDSYLNNVAGTQVVGYNCGECLADMNVPCRATH
jgi:hypothetical protein